MTSTVLTMLLAAPARGEPPARAEAERRIAALQQFDAMTAYRLALALAAEGHADLAQRAYERVIAAEPEHLAARRALGFERVDGLWLAGDDLRRAKGFVPVAGKWVLAEEANPADPNLPRLRDAVVRLKSTRSEDRAQAARELGRLSDRRAIPHLVESWHRQEARALTGYFSQTRQMSYVRDFDVEVA
jgi:tetratricopeptide (TPR) repeat protein